MSTIDKNATQLDLFAESRTSVSPPEAIPSVPLANELAPVFLLHERRVARESQDERRLTRKVLALLEL